MECKDVTHILSGFLDMELDKGTSDIVKEHLENCPSCREESVLLGEVSLFIKEYGEIEASDNFTAETMGRLYGEKRPASFPLPAFLYSFVFAMFFFLGILISFSPGDSEERKSTMESVSEILLNSQELNLLNLRNNSFNNLLGAENEKRVD